MPRGSSLGLPGLEGIGFRASVQMERWEAADQDPLHGGDTDSVAASQPASQELRRPQFSYWGGHHCCGSRSGGFDHSSSGPVEEFGIFALHPSLPENPSRSFEGASEQGHLAVTRISWKLKIGGTVSPRLS